MDRDRIERRDFPTGRRGYDPAAVDEHLRRLADEFEARSHAPASSMASSTSEQVRLILQAAEDGAAEMRAAAGSQASDHVTRVQAAADEMLTKLDALEAELARLLSALRTSGERLVEGLAELHSDAAGALGPDERRRTPAIHEKLDARDPAPAADAEPSAATPPEVQQDVVPKDVVPNDAVPQEAVSQDAVPEDADSRDGVTAPESPPLSAPGAPDWPAPADALFADAPADDSLFAAPPEEEEAAADDASARLIALNMALNGSSRDDTRVFLAEHFSLPDLEALLDDVYARAGR